MGTPKLFLEVIGGEDLGARIDLDAPTRTIGRADDSDLVLRDRAVSRRHAIVTCTETGRVYLETCPGKSRVVVTRSETGSHLETCPDHAVQKLDLKPGMEFVLGNTTIAVRSFDAKHAPAPSRNNGGTTERRGLGIRALHMAAFDALISWRSRMSMT